MCSTFDSFEFFILLHMSVCVSVIRIIKLSIYDYEISVNDPHQNISPEFDLMTLGVAQTPAMALTRTVHLLQGLCA